MGKVSESELRGITVEVVGKVEEKVEENEDEIEVIDISACAVVETESEEEDDEDAGGDVEEKKMEEEAGAPETASPASTPASSRSSALSTPKPNADQETIKDILHIVHTEVEVEEEEKVDAVEEKVEVIKGEVDDVDQDAAEQEVTVVNVVAAGQVISNVKEEDVVEVNEKADVVEEVNEKADVVEINEKADVVEINEKADITIEENKTTDTIADTTEEMPAVHGEDKSAFQLLYGAQPQVQVQDVKQQDVKKEKTSSLVPALSPDLEGTTSSAPQAQEPEHQDERQHEHQDLTKVEMVDRDIIELHEDLDKVKDIIVELQRQEEAFVDIEKSREEGEKPKDAAGGAKSIVNIRSKCTKETHVERNPQ